MALSQTLVAAATLPVVLLSVPPAAAQTTPAPAPHDSTRAPAPDSARAAAPAPDRWSAVFDFAYTGASGNNQLSMLTSGARITHLTTRDFEMEFSAQLRYGRSAGREIARSSRVGLKFDYHPLADWSPFVFLSVEQEPFRRLDLRTYGGGGVKRVILRSSSTDLSVSTAAVYSLEQLRPAASTPVAPGQGEVRSSWRIKGSHSFSETSRIENTTFYQPLWDRPTDYLIDAQTALTVQLSRALALKISYSYERDSTPAPGVHREDRVLSMGLSVQL